MRTAYVIANAILAFTLAACSSTATDLDAGLWHYKAGLYEQAIPRLVVSVPAIEAANPADPRVVGGYLALGQMATARKAPPGTSEGYYLKAQAAASKYHSDNATLSRNVASETGNFYIEQDQPAKALPFLLKAAEISERDQSTPRMLYAIDLDNISVAQSALKNDAVAVQYSQNALKQLANVPDSKELRATRGIVLFNLAVAYDEGGQPIQADESYRRSLELIEANGEAWRRRIVVTNYAKFLRAQRRELDAQAIERRYPQ